MKIEKYKFPPEEKPQLLREIRLAYRANNEREFMQILRRLGVKDENPLFAAAVKLFRDLRSGKT